MLGWAAALAHALIKALEITTLGGSQKRRLEALRVAWGLAVPWLPLAVSGTSAVELFIAISSHRDVSSEWSATMTGGQRTDLFVRYQ